MDGDIIIELDLTVPVFRAAYYLGDLTNTTEVSLLKRILIPSDVCVDIGANIGYVTLIMAKYAREVYSYEPMPSTYKWLVRNTQLNPRLAAKVKCYEMALSDHTDIQTMYMPTNEPQSASLQPGAWAQSSTSQVKVGSLDRHLTDIAPSFIKIDVEGAEYDVLHGAARTVERNHPIVFSELSNVYQARFGHNCREIYDFFIKWSYTCLLVWKESQFDAGPISIDPLPRELPQDGQVRNGLFIPADRVNEVLARIR
ncbi:MAG: FkbM family methyltransferase [Candidatus Marsarchaeota archaeon]|nr:FkbM family methyltransferase [Candidatus Marsarchaeota archaeon]